ncbi:MFS transporter [Robbsia sp. KACC 23696]|uniref:MFS transporter n=1 Tax=Robbsia sp. KACC 23696 TaxID=3149231 RepID=UPI00325AF243
MQNDTPRLGRSGLYILLAGQLLPLIDFSIINVALDPIAKALGANQAQLELVVAVYGVAFAVCLAMGSRLGDRLGRRRVFGWGVALFGIASLLCGLSSSVPLMLAARMLQGVGAALIVPQILAMIHVTLKGREHSRALALYGGVGGLAFVIGQVLGGLLVTLNIGGLGWRNVFFINLPICVIVLWNMRKALPETLAPRASRIDWPGTILLSLVILCLLVPLSVGPVHHWPWESIVPLLFVPVFGWALWRVEQRQERRALQDEASRAPLEPAAVLLNHVGAKLSPFPMPLLPPSLLRVGSVRFALLLGILFFCCWSGFMFAMALFLQVGVGMSALQSGNSFIALGTAYFASAMLTARMVERFGKLPTLLCACALQIVGLVALIFTLVHTWPHLTLWAMVPASILIGFAQAFIVSNFFRIGLSEIPMHLAGGGSAMLSTLQQAAFALGATLLGGVFAQALHSSNGQYLHAIVATLIAETILVAILLACTVRYLRQAPTTTGAASSGPVVTPME